MTIKKWTYAVGFTAGLALVACSGENGQDGLPGVDGTSCVAKALKDSSGFEMYCGDELMGVIKNGADGADGKDGKNGTNGKDGLAPGLLEDFNHAKTNAYETFIWSSAKYLEIEE